MKLTIIPVEVNGVGKLAIGIMKFTFARPSHWEFSSLIIHYLPCISSDSSRLRQHLSWAKASSISFF